MKLSKRRIATKDVFDFKENYCNENEIIIHLLTKNLKQYIVSPILDVGSGIGDIAYKGFAEKKVIMIDVNAISRHDYPCRHDHIRKKCDFFDFFSKDKINTIFISHTLQFIDDDLVAFAEKIESLQPENVIIVANSNNDFLNDLILWTHENVEVSNPEIPIKNFSNKYNLIRSEPFVAELKCPDFETLAKQVSYLMLFESNEAELALLTFLKKSLLKPEFTINQSINIYRRNDN